MTARLIAYGIAVAVLISVFVYGRYVYNEAKRVPALVSTINTLEKQRRDERDAAQKALVAEARIRAELGDSRARAADLARRLRRAYASVPNTPSGPAESPGTDGTGNGADEIDAAVTEVIGACKRDSIKAQEWQRWYESVPAELK